MQITNRVENPLLGRVELKFAWQHPKAKTPSLAAMISAAVKAEPGSIREQIFVLGVNTRFGQSTTTGTIHIYQTAESAEREAKYLIERHQRRGAHSTPKEDAEEAPVAAKPEPEPAPAEEPKTESASAEESTEEEES
jgi:ribosomal protein S24E